MWRCTTTGVYESPREGGTQTPDRIQPALPEPAADHANLGAVLMPNYLYERYVASGSTLPYRAWCQKNKTFQANECKRAMGWYVPNAQHIHYVHLTAMPVPKNARTIKGLTQEQDCIWVRSLRTAKILVEMDHDHGGGGTFITFEIRMC